MALNTYWTEPFGGDPQAVGYDQAGYEQPGYEQAGYEQPGYGQAGYNQAGYGQTGYVPGQIGDGEMYISNPNPAANMQRAPHFGGVNPLYGNSVGQPPNIQGDMIYGSGMNNSSNIQGGVGRGQMYGNNLPHAPHMQGIGAGQKPGSGMTNPNHKFIGNVGQVFGSGADHTSNTQGPAGRTSDMFQRHPDQMAMIRNEMSVSEMYESGLAETAALPGSSTKEDMSEMYGSMGQQSANMDYTPQQHQSVVGNMAPIDSQLAIDYSTLLVYHPLSWSISESSTQRRPLCEWTIPRVVHCLSGPLSEWTTL